MSEGWICLHRGWRDNAIFKGEFSRADAWVWLIESACWRPTRVRIKGETIDLQRGELTFALRFMADKWGWSKSRVDRFLADLREEGMIETRTKNGTTAGHNAGQGQSIITICNYAKYQDVVGSQRDNGGPEGGTRAGQQRDNGGTKKNKETIKQELEERVCDARDADFHVVVWRQVQVAIAAAKPRKPPAATPHRMTEDWQPAPLPTSVATLAALWPPGRLRREAEQFRDYWLDRPEKRPGWDRSFHNRIRDIHDRVLRENAHGKRNRTNARNDDDEPRNPMLRAELARQAREAAGVA